MRRRTSAIPGPTEQHSEVPDFLIQAVWTRRGIDKLEIYWGLGVPDVWPWWDRQCASPPWTRVSRHRQQPLSPRPRSATDRALQRGAKPDRGGGAAAVARRAPIAGVPTLVGHSPRPGGSIPLMRQDLWPTLARLSAFRGALASASPKSAAYATSRESEGCLPTLMIERSLSQCRDDRTPGEIGGGPCDLNFISGQVAAYRTNGAASGCVQVIDLSKKTCSTSLISQFIG